jgi:hypothetical protein
VCDEHLPSGMGQFDGRALPAHTPNLTRFSAYLFLSTSVLHYVRACVCVCECVRLLWPRSTRSTWRGRKVVASPSLVLNTILAVAPTSASRSFSPSAHVGYTLGTPPSKKPTVSSSAPPLPPEKDGEAEKDAPLPAPPPAWELPTAELLLVLLPLVPLPPPLLLLWLLLPKPRKEET